MLFCLRVELFFAEHGEDLHLLHDLADVFHGVHNITGAGFTLGADHGRALGDPPQGLAQIARTTNKRDGKGMLIDVMRFVSGGEDF